MSEFLSLAPKGFLIGRMLNRKFSGKHRKPKSSVRNKVGKDTDVAKPRTKFTVAATVILMTILSPLKQ